MGQGFRRRIRWNLAQYAGSQKQIEGLHAKIFRRHCEKLIHAAGYCPCLWVANEKVVDEEVGQLNSEKSHFDFREEVAHVPNGRAIGAP